LNLGRPQLLAGSGTTVCGRCPAFLDRSLARDGFAEQIFGINEQIPEARQSDQ
jgi:hypothetical protein